MVRDLNHAGRAEGAVVSVLDVASVALVREAVRAAAIEAGFSEVPREALTTAASELAHNQLSHARSGAVEVRLIDRSGVPGVEVIAADGGVGISDPEGALHGRSEPSGGLGVGLAGACRFADEVDFDIRAGEGTTVTLRKYRQPVAKTEVAIFGRPIAGERLSGDDAAFARFSDGSLLLAVADGLGHGPDAREASRRAIQAVREHASEAPHDIVRLCEPAVSGTRGTVLSVVRLDRALGQLQHAGAGNIAAQVTSPRFNHRFVSPSRVLGMAPWNYPPKLEVVEMPARSTLVMFTDGVSTRADLTGDLETMHLPPIVLAQRVLEKWGKTTDDALVLVAR